MTTRLELAAATAALRKLGGTYITKHASEIAQAALTASTLAIAESNVRALVGHTSVGARRFAELARVARAAAAPNCSACGRPDPLLELDGRCQECRERAEEAAERDRGDGPNQLPSLIRNAAGRIVDVG